MIVLGMLLARRADAEGTSPSATPAGEDEGSGVVPTRSPARPPRRRLVWDERWHRFRPVEYASTALTGAAAIGVFWFASASERPKWTSPILFDAAFRDTFRLRTRSGLEVAATSSSILAYVPATQALIDSIILPAAAGNFDLMWQTGMMDAQAFALSGLVVSSLYDTTGRARPSYNDCKTGKSVDPLCNSGEFASFPSGHTAVAMTGAGLMCAHHEELALYGSRALDVGACVEGITFSAGVGILRVMADRHYVSDVLTGGAIGFFSGYALPRLLHYWKRPLGEVVHREELRVGIVLGAANTPMGIRAVGEF
jgi:membrane-associated phospholipid phosphatase